MTQQAIKTLSPIIKKYNVAAPRYTSYPTVPFWDADTFSQGEWLKRMNATFQATNAADGIGIYIHLPYCESLCTYCGCNTRITVNHAVERPYIEAVIKEWKMYTSQWTEAPRIRALHLGGGTPTFFSPHHLELLVRSILLNAELADDVDFSFEAHPANTTPAHLQVLYKLGFRRLSLGIQDFDPAVQDMIHRFQSVQQVENVVAIARDLGYTSINFDLIYGLPLQTTATVHQTIQEVLRMRPDRIAFYSYAHVPWMKPGQRKYSDSDLPAEDAKLSLYELGRTLFLKAGYEDVGMDHFALPSDDLVVASKRGELHRNFMGYTTKQTELLIGLGVSSISDCWTAFAQNHKTVEAYMGALLKNEWPLLKGHALNDEDLDIRRHIVELMCTFATPWPERIPITEELHREIKEMQADGLIRWENNRLTMTARGRQFVRNAGMLLDLRLRRSEAAANRFSAAV